MQLRAHNVRQLSEQTFDVLIIGGGINGAVSAAALAGQGASVALIDQRDFAGFTSQQSSNLAWGGIKYMETYEFGLVRQLCKSRNELIRSFPSAVQEIRFLTTIRRGFRHHPRKLWLGTWLYWLIGERFTRTPRLLSARQIEQLEPVIDTRDSIGGFEYSDAYFYDNDARFVFNFVRGAMDQGCVAANYVEVRALRRRDDIWEITARDLEHGSALTVRSRVLVNAAGPFVDRLNQLAGVPTEHHHVYSKGIHLIVDRITANRRVLAFFADDGRLFFAIPMGSKTCIGTTDTRVERPETEVTAADRRFVLDNINRCLTLQRPLSEADIIAERCGVRPLAVQEGATGARDFLQLSRQHAVDVDRHQAHLSIFGGKLTDCLNLGDEVSAHVRAMGVQLPRRDRRWYGEPGAEVRDRYLQLTQAVELDRYTVAGASESLTTRLWRRYGAEAMALVEAIRRDPREAELLIDGTEYLRCEIQQAARREMIVRLEDFLRRRSKIALVVRRDQIRKAEGLREACRILFGDRAQRKLDEYFEANDRSAPDKGRAEMRSEALNW